MVWVGWRCRGENFMLEEMEHKRLEAQSYLVVSCSQLYLEDG